MKKYLILLVTMFLFGCGEYIPHQQFEIKTTDGKVFILSCPVIDLHRNMFSYNYDGRCVVIKQQNK